MSDEAERLEICHLSCHEQNVRSLRDTVLKKAKTTTPRLGIEIYGTLVKCTRDRAGKNARLCNVNGEVSDAIKFLQLMTQVFQAENVFLIPYAGRHGRRLPEIEHWLVNTLYVTKTVGIRKENIIFHEHRVGRNGKGPIAKRLRLTHYIDDDEENLQDVYRGFHGNAAVEIEDNGGELFLFPRSGDIANSKTPRSFFGKLVPKRVMPVRGFADIVKRLSK